jgi:hypothetical protein
MHTMDQSYARQLHVDRTARLTSTRRGQRLPRLSVSSLFSRREQRQAVTKPATAC